MDVLPAEFMPAILRVAYGLFIGHCQKKDQIMQFLFVLVKVCPLSLVYLSTLVVIIRRRHRERRLANTGGYTGCIQSVISKTANEENRWNKKSSREKIGCTGFVEEQREIYARAEKIMSDYEGKKSWSRNTVIVVRREEKIMKAVAIIRQYIFSP